jgi:Fe-coproporphyrin III synthase
MGKATCMKSDEICRPEIMILPVGYACGCRCVMCSIWTRDPGKPPAISDFEAIFGDPLLGQHLKKINLTGGEPFLRKDLPALVRRMNESFAALTQINVSSNGLFADQMIDSLHQILRTIRPEIHFNVYFSLDGIGKTHNTIRGVKNAFGSVLESYFKLRSYISRHYLDGRWATGFSTTVSTFNYREIDLLIETYQALGASFGFTIANESDVFLNTRAVGHTGWKPQGDQVAEFADLFDRLYEQLGNPFYRMTSFMLRGRPRPIGCFYRTNGFLLDVDGSVYVCGSHADGLLGNLKDSAFSELWTGPNADEVRRKIALRCSSCMSDCYSAESLTEALLDSQLPKDGDFILFGAGALGRQTGARLAEKGRRIAWFVDNDSRKWDTPVMGIPVLRPTELMERRSGELILITSAPGHAQIHRQLTAMGYRHGRDFLDMTGLSEAAG